MDANIIYSGSGGGVHTYITSVVTVVYLENVQSENDSKGNTVLCFIERCTPKKHVLKPNASSQL